MHVYIADTAHVFQGFDVIVFIHILIQEHIANIVFLWQVNFRPNLVFFVDLAIREFLHIAGISLAGKLFHEGC